MHDTHFAPEDPTKAFTVHTRWIDEDFDNKIPAYSGVSGGMANPDARQNLVVEVNGKRVEVTLPGDGIIGGGSKSGVWRQIAADCFNAEVVTLSTSEGAALGAAIQAAHARANEKIATTSYDELCARLVRLDEATRCKPDPAKAALYAAQLERQMDLTGRLNQTGWL